MRQVFSSPRLENVEGVASLLKDQGIEIYISDGRSYNDGHRRVFTYRDHARSRPDPALWIVNANDQPRAREILREAGLLESTRPGFSASQPMPVFATNAPSNSIRPTRVLLFMVIIVLAIASALRGCAG